MRTLECFPVTSTAMGTAAPPRGSSICRQIYVATWDEDERRGVAWEEDEWGTSEEDGGD